MISFPVIGGLALALFSLYMLSLAIGNFRKALESTDWPSVRGRLVDIHLWGKRNVNGEMKDAEKLSVKYEYSAEEAEHTGDTVAFYTLHFPETLKFSEDHPGNSGVTVYYQPGNASVSVLVPGRRKEKPYSELIIASLGLIVGVAFAALAWTGVFA